MLFINSPIYLTLQGYTFELKLNTSSELIELLNNLNNMILIKSSWAVKEGESSTEPCRFSISNYKPKE